MSNHSRKIKISPLENEVLKKFLEREGFEFKAHEHAFFRAQKNGITIILYNNQTLFFQGDEKKIEVYYNNLKELISSDDNANDILGLDESGKGDVFGPLVLAGAIIKGELKEYTIDDSKNLSDEKITIVFNSIKDKILYKVRIITPEEYNELYQEYKNLNKLMTKEYKKLILSFPKNSYKKIILDKYSLSYKEIEFLKSGIEKPFDMFHKGENFLPVAAASIVARYYFLEWFKGQELDLPKGSSNTVQEKFLKLKQEGKIELSKIAKMSFKLSFQNLSLQKE